jgi:hypothetical protein
MGKAYLLCEIGMFLEQSFQCFPPILMSLRAGGIELKALQLEFRARIFRLAGRYHNPTFFYRPARLNRLAISIPGNRFLDYIKDYKYGLCPRYNYRYQTIPCKRWKFFATNIHSWLHETNFFFCSL